MRLQIQKIAKVSSAGVYIWGKYSIYCSKKSLLGRNLAAEKAIAIETSEENLQYLPEKEF